MLVLIIMNDRSNHLCDKGPELCDKGAPEVSDTTINIHDSVSKTRKSKSAYQREWYKKLIPEQKKARNERQKMHDSTLAQLEGKRACKRRRNELKRNIRHTHSIAMENPHYVPKLLDPAKDGAKVSAADVSIPQFDWTPIYIIYILPSREEQSPDLEAPEMLDGRLNHRHHVTHGERYSLLTRRNRHFASNMARKSCRTVHEDQGIYEDNDEEVSLPQTPTQPTGTIEDSLDQSQPKYTGIQHVQMPRMIAPRMIVTRT